jgi:hypothetical protein
MRIATRITAGTAPTLRAVSLAVILFGAVGCATVQQVQPAQFIPAHNPGLVWVATHDTVLAVVGAQIDGDTLRGNDVDGPVALPLANIQGVRAKAPAPDRTTLLVAGVVALGMYVIKFGSIGSSGSFDYVYDGPCHCVFRRE